MYSYTTIYRKFYRQPGNKSCVYSALIVVLMLLHYIQKSTARIVLYCLSIYFRLFIRVYIIQYVRKYSLILFLSVYHLLFLFVYFVNPLQKLLGSPTLLQWTSTQIEIMWIVISSVTYNRTICMSKLCVSVFAFT